MKDKKNNNLNEEILSIIKDNFIQIILILIVSFGLIYLGIYYLTYGFFPNLSTEEFLQLSLLYFGIIIITSIMLTIMFFVPGEQIYQIKHNSDKIEKIFAWFILIIILSVPILYIIILWIILKENNITIISFLKKNLFAVIIAILIIIFGSAFNKVYYKAKKNKNNKNISLILFVIWFSIAFLLAPFFSKKTTNIFHLGNYEANLIINNETICSNITHNKNKTCYIKGTVIWNIGNNYLLEINNTRYKIPSQYILMEKFKTSQKINNSQKINKNEQKGESNKHKD